MKVIDFYNYFNKLMKEGKSEISVGIITSDNNPPFDYSIVGINEISNRDPGGWGNEIVLIEPKPKLKIKGLKSGNN